jgi:uncharacterized protein
LSTSLAVRIQPAPSVPVFSLVSSKRYIIPGDLTAMPGALPTIWCDMHGLPKNQQRGVVQPFIAAMQLFALALMLSRHDISAKVLIDFAISIPALAAGTALGILTFRHANELTFRRVILVVLLFSGLALAI